jgi:putative transport protein
MQWLAGTLRDSPEIAVFLTLGLGALVGGARLGRYSVGTASGALLVGLALGQLEIPVDASTKALLFLLFLFANGYAVGPQFVSGLQRSGVRPLTLAAFQAAVGLAVCVAFARLLGLDPGLAGGLLSGSLTQSPAIGTAVEAIGGLPLDQAERERLVGHVAVAHALTYVFGSFGAIWFLSRAAPRLLGIDLAGSARALEKSLGVEAERPGIMSAYRPFAVRGYRVENPAAAGRTVGELEAAFEGRRLFVLRLRRGAEIAEVTRETRIERGDVVALGGRLEWVVQAGPTLGPEAADPGLLDFALAAATVVVSHAAAGRSLAELAAMRETRAVAIRRITRLGEDVPILPGTTLETGDLVELAGPEPDVERVGAMLGRALQPTMATDLAVVGIAIAIGGAIGPVAALAAGVAVGHAAARRSGFGRIPPAALELMRNLGLAGFVGMTGIQAGPHFVAAFREAGAPLLFAGAACTLAPLACGVLFARHVLKMNPVLALGACAGAQTATPALAAVQEASGSRIAVLGYGVPYAVGQILLTLWGSAIIALSA